MCDDYFNIFHHNRWLSLHLKPEEQSCRIPRDQHVILILHPVEEVSHGLFRSVSRSRGCEVFGCNRVQMCEMFKQQATADFVSRPSGQTSISYYHVLFPAIISFFGAGNRGINQWVAEDEKRFSEMGLTYIVCPPESSVKKFNAVLCGHAQFFCKFLEVTGHTRIIFNIKCDGKIEKKDENRC